MSHSRIIALAFMAMLPLSAWSQDDNTSLLKSRLAGKESRTWTWNTEAPNNGTIWGNMGYHGASGKAVALYGEGLWWGVTSEEELLERVQYESDTHIPTGEESMEATMTFYADGFICCNDADGNRIRQGQWSISVTPDVKDGFKEANLCTSEGSILFPFVINQGGLKVTNFEVLSLTNSTLTLCYAQAGSGEWSEATFWQFKALDEGDSEYISTIDGVSYEILSERNHTCQVVCSKPDPSIRNIEISPDAMIDGQRYSVTRIDAAAFSNRRDIESVTIPESVTEIGGDAFSGCSSLKSITLPNAITQIEANTFKNCTSLASVTLSSNLTTIDYDAFSGCSALTKLTLPASLTTIRQRAFNGCSRLTSFTVTKGNPMFRSFNGVVYDTDLTTLLLLPPGLTSFEVPEDIVEIGEGACYGAALTSITLPSDLERIGADAFSTCTELKSIDIPASVTELGNGAFWGCSSLTEVIIPEGIDVLSTTFGSCTSLRSVILPESLIELRNGVFQSCSSLESITIPASVRVMDGWGVFHFCNNLKEIRCLVEEPINIVPSELFDDYGNGFLPTIYVPYQSLSAYMQSSWSAMTLRALPETVPVGVHSTFYYTTKDGAQLSLYTDRTLFYDLTGQPLEILSHTLQSDGQWAIELNGIALGIARDAFYYQNNLKTVSLPSTITEIGIGAFGYCYMSEIELPESVTALREQALRGNDFETLTLPQSLQRIESGAIAGCHNLRSLDIPAHVSYIAEQWDLTALETITVDKDNHHYLSPNQCNVIIDNHNGVILGCRNSVIPEGVKSINHYAFSGCPLTSITLPESLEYIYSNAFYNCHELTTLRIPKNVRWLLDAPFSGCDHLSSITVDLQNPYFDSREDCNAIIETATNTLVLGCPSTVIPASVTTIGSYAYYGQSTLTSIQIPSTVTRIGSYAFAQSGLTTIAIPTSVKTIDAEAFLNCRELSSIYLPGTIERIGNYAFNDNYHLHQHYYWYTDQLPQLDGDIFWPWSSHTLHVPADRVDYFRNAFPMSTYPQTYVEPLPSALEILDDAAAFDHPYELEYNTVTYTRQFSHTNWQALYLPFELSYYDWTDDFEVARINNFHQYDIDLDGEPDETVMELFVVKGGQLQANYPYLIRAKQAGEHTLSLSNAVVMPADELSYQCASMDRHYTFRGTYHQIPGETMFGQGYYAMGDGNLIMAEDATASLGAFRWYLDVTDLDGNKVSPLKASLRIMGEESETGIDTIGYETEYHAPAFIGIDGRLLQAPRGMYIQHGQKMFKK